MLRGNRTSDTHRPLMSRLVERRAALATRGICQTHLRGAWSRLVERRAALATACVTFRSIRRTSSRLVERRAALATGELRPRPARVLEVSTRRASSSSCYVTFNYPVVIKTLAFALRAVSTDRSRCWSSSALLTESSRVYASLWTRASIGAIWPTRSLAVEHSCCLHISASPHPDHHVSTRRASSSSCYQIDEVRLSYDRKSRLVERRAALATRSLRPARPCLLP